MPPKLSELEPGESREIIVQLELHADREDLREVPQLEFPEKRMAETFAMKEGDKLRGDENYYIWSRKMQIILRGEGMWTITKEETNPASFPVKIDREDLTVVQFWRRKDLGCKVISMSIVDDLVDTIVDLTDPTKVWAALKEQYSAVDKT